MDGSNGIPAVELRGITKVFPGVVANDGIDLDLYRGEIHCLLGENGAGKSTLMQILAGMYLPDAGTVTLDGVRVEVDSPQTAIAHGVGMVYQHPTLVPTFTVLENLLLGNEGPGRRRNRLRLDRQGARASLAELAVKLGTAIDADAKVGSLPLGRQQQVEIVKALWRGSSVLVLDEPTAMLTPRETEDLASVLGSLKDQGMALVVISHKLREALAWGDRVTVLRQGRVAGRLSPSQLRGGHAAELHRAIVGMMFGDEAGESARVAEEEAGERPGRFARSLPAEPVLELRGVSAKPDPQSPGLHEVSFAVRRGEVFGIAGVDGNGQRELAEVIAGQRRAASGVVRLGGTDVTRAGVAERRRLGLGYVTDDRLGEGIVASLPLSLNLLLKRIGEQPFWSRLGAIARDRVRVRATELVDEYDIRVPGPDTTAGTLSGGNIQKALLARELSAKPQVVVYNKPTHGLDFKTTIAIRDKITQLAARDGVAAVLISTDLDELVETCDRVGVLSLGRLAGVVDNAGAGVEQRIGELMVGAGREGLATGVAAGPRSDGGAA
jgi:general nucleoside transport system ATP-binding protein